LRLLEFIDAVIDEAAFRSIVSYIEEAKASSDYEVLCGGRYDAEKGFFIQPRWFSANAPVQADQEEIFGPVATVYVYPDDEYEETLRVCDSTTPTA